jgi:hypothetical protein
MVIRAISKAVDAGDLVVDYWAALTNENTFVECRSIAKNFAGHGC